MPTADSSASAEESMRLDAFTKRETFTFDRVGPVAMDPDGRWAAVGTGDEIRILDLDRGVEAGILAPESASGIGSLVFAPDGASVAAAIAPGLVVVLGVPTGELLHRIDIVKSSSRTGVGDLAISPDGAVLVVAAGEELGFFDLESGDPLNTLTAAEETYFAIWRVVWSRDGALLASSGNDRIVRIWPTSNLSGLTLESARCVVEVPEAVLGLGFAPSDNVLVTVDFNGEVRAWNPDSCDLLATFATEGRHVWRTALSPEGTQVVMGGEDGTIRALSTMDGTVVSKIQASPNSSEIVLDYAGRRLLSVSPAPEPTEVTLWERR